jgi:hypothetical protein
VFDTCPFTEDAAYWKTKNGFMKMAFALIFSNPQSLDDEASALPLCNSFWRFWLF